jgi:hypothetical protein
MSHVATIDIEIRDLDALEQACRALGLELVRGQQTYRWYGQHVGDYPLPAGFAVEDLGRCEHAIRIPGAKIEGDLAPYEVGVVRRRDGRPGYSLMWDFFAGGYGLQQRVGKDCTKLKQQYAVAVATRTAQRQGLRVQQTVGANGSIVLRCVK